MAKLKAIKTYTALVDGEGNRNSEFLNTSIEFDSNENVILEVKYNDDGTFESKAEYEYDEQSKIKLVTDYYDENEVNESKEFHRNQENEVVKIIHKYGDGSITTKIVEQNNGEEVITATDEDDEFDGKEIKKIDESGRLIEHAIFDYDNKLEEKQLYEYDESGKTLSSKEYGRGEEFISHKKFQYDIKGNCTLEISLSAKGKIQRRIQSKFDENNNVIEQQHDEQYLVKFEYDNNKNETKREIINLANNLKENMVSFIYDEENRIVEQITYSYGMARQFQKNVLVEGASDYLSTIYKYEFF